MAVSEIPKVILLVETSVAFGRGLLRGITKYSRLHGPWVFYREALAMEKVLPRLKDWGASGMIIHETAKIKIGKVKAMAVPAIVCPHIEGPISGVPSMIGDDDAIGRMGANYLLDAGFHNFAFCGFDSMFWSQNRAKSFNDRLADAGFKVFSYQQPKSARGRLWENEQSVTANWLRSLPKPVGIMACNDTRGQHVTEACKIAGLRIPDEVAVLGVDNDQFVCDLCDPPLSSIAYNSERAGYEAAALLDELMAGKKKSANQRILIQATHIVPRQSTDILAVEDADVAKAVRFIRKHAKKAIQVNDVAEAIALPRNSLYKKFRKILGHSPNEEITRARVEQIARMLVETNMSISEIASTLEYSSTAHVARYFRRGKGMSLMAYRKRYGKK